MGPAGKNGPCRQQICPGWAISNSFLGWKIEKKSFLPHKFWSEVIFDLNFRANLTQQKSILPLFSVFSPIFFKNGGRTTPIVYFHGCRSTPWKTVAVKKSSKLPDRRPFLPAGPIFACRSIFARRAHFCLQIAVVGTMRGGWIKRWGGFRLEAVGGWNDEGGWGVRIGSWISCFQWSLERFVIIGPFQGHQIKFNLGKCYFE